MLPPAEWRHNDNVSFIVADANEEALSPPLNSGDNIFDRQLPLFGTVSPDMGDVFNGTVAVRFVDACNLKTSGHDGPFLNAGPILTTRENLESTLGFTTPFG